MQIVATFILSTALNFALGLVVAALLGPAEFGRFALAATLVVVVATLAFDWLRLSAARHYNETSRREDRALRASLEAAFWIAAALVLALALAMAGAGLNWGVNWGLSAPAILLVAGAAIANGRFEFLCALARALFLNAVYLRLVLVRSVLAFAAMSAAGWWSGRAEWVLGALALAGIIAVLLFTRALRDRETSLRSAQAARARAFANYGLPVVAANVAYQVMVLVNRAAAAAWFGYDASGQLSLATDITIRLVLSLGAALDVYLFQTAVRSENTAGREAAQTKLTQNMTLVTLVLVLLSVGFVASMPAFEAMAVPAAFRGQFGFISTLLVPGVLFFCLMQFALNPVFQMANRTAPVLWSALIGVSVNLIGLVLMPRSYGIAGIAVLHSASLCAGFLAALVFAIRSGAVLPPWRDLAAIVFAGAAAYAAIWPLRDLSPPILSLVLSLFCGTAVYVTLTFALNVAGLRTIVKSYAFQRLN